MLPGVCLSGCLVHLGAKTVTFGYSAFDALHVVLLQKVEVMLPFQILGLLVTFA